MSLDKSSDSTPTLKGSRKSIILNEVREEFFRWINFKYTILLQMSDVKRAAYDAFRCDLAKVQRKFNSCTQTEFTDEVGTETDLNLSHKPLQLVDKCLRSPRSYDGWE